MDSEIFGGRKKEWIKSEGLEKQKEERTQMDRPTIMGDRFAGQCGRQREEKEGGKIEMQRGEEVEEEIVEESRRGGEKRSEETVKKQQKAEHK